MTRRYFVETEAEAGRAIERLSTCGYTATSEPHSQGHLVTVEGPASVAVEEILIGSAPTVRRVLESHDSFRGEVQSGSDEAVGFICEYSV